MTTSIQIKNSAATPAKMVAGREQPTGTPDSLAARLHGPQQRPAPDGLDSSIRGHAIHMEKSASPNAPIQDYQTTRSSIDVDQSAQIHDLKVQLNIQHDWRGDLVVTLTSPQGRIVPVISHEGGSEDNIRATFDLSNVFAGQDSQGAWTLSVSDESGQDQGTLNGWSLVIDGVEAPPK